MSLNASFFRLVIVEVWKKFYLKTFVSECTQWFSMGDFLILSQTLKPIQEWLGPLRTLRPAPYLYSSVQFSSVIAKVVSSSLWLHGLQHTRPPCPSSTPEVYSNSCPLSRASIQPSHPLSSPSPPAFNLSQHQDFFKWVSSSHQVAKGLEFQLQHQSFWWIFRINFL